MPKIIKVRCTGQNRHINEINLDQVIRENLLLRGAPKQPASIPERIVCNCRFCPLGKVIITRQMVEENL